MIESILCGVHTYSVGMVLTYKQFKKIRKACYETGCVQDTSNIFNGKERLYCYAYHEQGLKVYLHGISGELYRLRIQIEPCRVLGDAAPAALFQPDKRSYRQMVKSADKLLKRLKVPRSVDAMKISRCDETLLGKHILRLEAELKRSSLKKHLGKVAMYENQNILVAAGLKCPKVISWYINRLQPKCEQYLRYENAVEHIKQVQLLKEKTRSRMLYLLRKTSDRDTLAAALEDLRIEENLSKSQCSNILKKFKQLGFSPITLRNNSKFNMLPALEVQGHRRGQRSAGTDRGQMQYGVYDFMLPV